MSLPLVFLHCWSSVSWLNDQKKTRRADHHFFFFNSQCPLPVCLLFSIFQPFYIVLYTMSMCCSCTYYEKEEKLCLFHLARSKILYSIFFFTCPTLLSSGSCEVGTTHFENSEFSKNESLGNKNLRKKT